MPRQIPIILVTRSEHEAAVAVMLRCVTAARSCISSSHGFQKRCCDDKKLWFQDEMLSRHGEPQWNPSSILLCSAEGRCELRFA